MTGSIRTMMLAAALAPGVALAASVEDGAKLFGKEAVEKAERKIATFERGTHRDFVVETFAEAKDLDKAKGPDKGDYFRDWARDRYRTRGVQGVYVLVTREPGRVQVEVGDRTKAHGVSPDAVQRAFLNHFGKKDFDGGLLAAVDYAAEAYASRRPSPAPAPAPSTAAADLPDWAGWVCVGLVALAAVWLVVGLIRAFSGVGRGGPGYDQPGYGGGGGGGFFSSMLGGLFGAAAGMYMYNSFFGSGAPSAWG
ncbi:MAG: TPM domain-containing protein, partial [Gemmataceae bacterium]